MLSLDAVPTHKKIFKKKKTRTLCCSGLQRDVHTLETSTVLSVCPRPGSCRPLSWLVGDCTTVIKEVELLLLRLAGINLIGRVKPQLGGDFQLCEPIGGEKSPPPPPRGERSK